MERPDVEVEQQDISSSRKVFFSTSLEEVIQRARSEGYDLGLFVQVEYGMHHGCLVLSRREKGDTKEWDAVITSSKQDGQVVYELYKRTGYLGREE